MDQRRVRTKTNSKQLQKVKRNISASTENRLASFGFLLPIMAVFIALFALPLGKSLYYSFTDYQALSPEVNFAGLDNYRAILNDSSMLTGLGFTLLFTVLVTLFTTVLAIPLAVALNARFMGQKLVRSLFFFLGVPSQVVLGLVWQYIFSPLDSGALNVIIRKLGGSAIPWLSDPTYARYCIIFVAIWAGVGWHATLYLAYLQSIPADLYEQARVDGATGIQQFFHITLPQLTPAITVSTFLLVTSGLKIYDLPYAMTKGGPGVSTNTVTQQIILEGVANSNYSLGSALAVVFTIASALIVLTQVWVVNKVTRRFA
ncbi:sugar ABC transporter permease [Actinomycetaceae bacterium TAE3-ERU4]|nr:sugar ABC transporter permease [Actinomycetaceae bacterium TAE3-ERU4]